MITFLVGLVVLAILVSVCVFIGWLVYSSSISTDAENTIVGALMCAGVVAIAYCVGVVARPWLAEVLR